MLNNRAVGCAILLSLFAFCPLGGCASTTNIAGRVDEAYVTQNNLSVLLVQLICEDARGVRHNLSASTPPSIARFEVLGFGDLSPLPFHITSEQGQSDGWYAFVWQAGYHHVVFGDASRSDITILDDVSNMQIWRFEVPSGVNILYAGTFLDKACGHPSPETRSANFGQAELQLVDRSAEAASVAMRDVPSLMPPVTRTAVKHTGPFLVGVPRASSVNSQE